MPEQEPSPIQESPQEFRKRQKELRRARPKKPTLATTEAPKEAPDQGEVQRKEKKSKKSPAYLKAKAKALENAISDNELISDEDMDVKEGPSRMGDLQHELRETSEKLEFEKLQKELEEAFSQDRKESQEAEKAYEEKYEGTYAVKEDKSLELGVATKEERMREENMRTLEESVERIPVAEEVLEAIPISKEEYEKNKRLSVAEPTLEAFPVDNEARMRADNQKTLEDWAERVPAAEEVFQAIPITKEEYEKSTQRGKEKEKSKFGGVGRGAANAIGLLGMGLWEILRTFSKITKWTWKSAWGKSPSAKEMWKELNDEEKKK